MRALASLTGPPAEVAVRALRHRRRPRSDRCALSLRSLTRRLEGRLYRLEELVPRGDELLHALADQDLDDVVVVDAGVGQCLHRGGRVGVERSHLVALDVAVV